MKRTKQGADRLLLAFSLPSALAKEYVDFMQLAHIMGNLAPGSSRDKVDMVLVAVILEATKGVRPPVGRRHRHD